LKHEHTIDDVLEAAKRSFPEIPLSRALLKAHQERLAEAEKSALAKASESQDQLAPFEGTEPGAPAPESLPAGEGFEASENAPEEAAVPAEPGMPDAEHAVDWALAAGCTAGLPEAIATVERTVLCDVPHFIRRIDASPSFAEELVQTLRERLLVTPVDGVARIGSYTGRGPLGGWIRVVAVRLALELKRKETVQAPENAADRLVDLALGPEDHVAKNEHTEAAQTALRIALTTLTTRQRNLLRLRFAEGWSPEDLGKTYGVHRGTIARWVQEAREHVKAAMAKELAKILGFSEDEMPSVMRAVESRLELTFSMLKSR
jgi:RNA polymerase sigma-70 factor, ECF subfamily